MKSIISVLLLLGLLSLTDCSYNELNQENTKDSPEIIKGIFHPKLQFDVYNVWKMQFENPKSASDFKNIVERHPWKWEDIMLENDSSRSLNFIRNEEKEMYGATRVEKSLMSLHYKDKNNEEGILMKFHIDFILKKMVYDTASHWIINELKVKIEHSTKISVNIDLQMEYDFFGYTLDENWIRNIMLLDLVISHKNRDIKLEINGYYSTYQNGLLTFIVDDNIRDKNQDEKVNKFVSDLLELGELKLTTTNLLKPKQENREKVMYLD
jgi:hypothetical protein